MSTLSRRVLERLRDELWPYVFFPLVFTAMAMGFNDRFGLADAPHLLRDTFIAIACIGAPVHLMFNLFYERLRSLPALRRLLVGAAIIALGVLGGTELALALLGPLRAGSHALPLGRQQIWAVAFVGVGSVAAVLLAFAQFRVRIRAVELRELRAQRDALAAQIQALQARMQPHFLFNCLNTVASLIEENPRRAESALEHLSDLLRHTLAASQRRLVPLREEIQAAEGFLELEVMRRDERLRYSLRVGPGLDEVAVPPLILQPLVENAVLHGIAHRREGGCVEVRVAREGDLVTLQVDDDGPGPSGSSYRGNGTALRDLGERLRLLYAEHAVLEHGGGALGGFRVRVSLPIRATEESPCAS